MKENRLKCLIPFPFFDSNHHFIGDQMYSSMEIIKNRILLIHLNGHDCYKKLYELLVTNNYEVCNINSVKSVTKMLHENVPDLIICQHEPGKLNGIRVYNTLKQDLVFKAIPFFLHLCEFKKEYILNGLDLGIDNFIFSTFNNTTLLKKIENQLNKKKKLNIFNSSKFRYMFQTIPEAKCFSKNEDIIMINDEFSRLTGVNNTMKELPKITSVFDFSGNENNSIIFYKCISRRNDCCLINNVPLYHNKSALFDIYMTHSNFFGNNIIFSDIIPVKGIKSNNENKNSNELTNYTPVKLTFREREILEYSMKGFEIKQIADKLKISCRTVEKHRSNIMEKTETHNIIEAIFYFYKRNSLSQIENVL